MIATGGEGTSADWEERGYVTGGQGVKGIKGAYNYYDENDEEPVFEAVGHDPAEECQELYKEERKAQGFREWWTWHFLLSEDKKVSFGTFDGVFTSCMTNLFGVITLLRAGWMVGNAGVGESLLVVLTTVVVSSTAVLSGISISERCRLHQAGAPGSSEDQLMVSGGIHSIISHVLGAQIGGAIGIVYSFGQAVSCALHAMGFAESMAKLLSITDYWVERAIGLTVVLVLLVINVAGVKWVLRLQFLLLVALLLAALDFAVGTFVGTDPERGVVGYDWEVLRNNTVPDYSPGENWFTVFGVFFPATTGIFAGVNMSGDLRNPEKSIPVGTFSAIGTSLFLYLLFVLGLGATCRRWALKSNYLISEHVSALGVFLLAGLYISAACSCLGSLYATPRVIQSMARENVLPGAAFLSQGKGPNKVPVAALVVFSAFVVAFVLIGRINTLAPIVTVPFLLTYACVEYAYFSMAMTYDIQKDREKRFATQQQEPTSYGAVQADLDNLFPVERAPAKTAAVTSSTPQTSATPGTSCTSGGYPEGSHGGSTTESPLTSPDEHSSVKSVESKVSSVAPTQRDSDFLLAKATGYRFSYGIDSKSRYWHSLCCNRYVAILGLVSKLVIVFLVQWGYALSMLLALTIFWIYIVQVHPGQFAGITEFKFFPWLHKKIGSCFGRVPSDYEHINVVTPSHPGLKVTSSQLNEQNPDYASRQPFHQQSTRLLNKSKFQDYDSD